MRKQSFAAPAVLLLLAGIAHAQGTGDRRWYVGLDVGQSKIDHEQGYVDTDDSSTAVTVLVGYRFNRYVALEAGYADLGEFSSELRPNCPQPPTPCPPTLQSDKSIDGFLINTVGIWPLAPHFQVNVTIGAIYRDLNVTTRVDSMNPSTYTYTDGVFKFGLGIGVPVNDRLDFNLDFTQYHSIGIGLGAGSGDDSLVTDGESQVLSLGVRWRF